MAGVVPRLYQLLSNAVEADDARARSQESGGTPPGTGVMEGIRAVLHGKPWLWVGDAFVPADQVRQTAVFLFLRVRDAIVPVKGIFKVGVGGKSSLLSPPHKN